MATVDDCIKIMIEEGSYRYKPLNKPLCMFDGETSWSYTEYVKSHNFIIGQKKNGTPEYLDLHTIDMDRKDFPIIKEVIYDPKLPFGKIKDEPRFNTAKALDVKFPIEAKNNNLDASIFWNHLDYLCGDVQQDIKEWVKDWLADIFQDPNNKKGTALIFIGLQGCGKSIFFDNLMSSLLSVYYLHTEEKDYSGKFNTELKDKLLVNFDEGYSTKSKLSNAKLKSFITQPNFKIQGKGTNSTTVLNPVRAVFTTNNYHAIDTSFDDRRYAIFRTIKKDFITQEYFDNFIKAINDKEMLEQFMFELKTRKIVSRLNQAPSTEEKETQKAFSADKLSEWFDYIITTNADYTAQVGNTPRNEYNYGGYLWNKVEENERWMFKENGLASYLNFKGDSNNIITTVRLFNALKIYLENKEWSITQEVQRPNQTSGFSLGRNATQRLWIFRKKNLSDNE